MSEIYDTVAQIKDLDAGKDLGLCPVVLRRCGLEDNAPETRVVITSQMSECIADVELLAGTSICELFLEANTKALAEATNLTRRLTVRVDGRMLSIQFPTMIDAWLFVVTVAAETARLHACSEQRGDLLAAPLKVAAEMGTSPARAAGAGSEDESDEDLSSVPVEISLKTMKLYTFDAVTLDMEGATEFAERHPLAFLPTSQCEGHCRPETLAAMRRVGTEMLVLITDAQLKQWSCLEGLTRASGGHDMTGSFANSSFSRPGGVSAASAPISKIYVIAVSVAKVVSEAKARKERLRRRLQGQGAVSLGMDLAARARSESMRRSRASLPPVGSERETSRTPSVAPAAVPPSLPQQEEANRQPDVVPADAEGAQHGEDAIAAEDSAGASSPPPTKKKKKKTVQSAEAATEGAALQTTNAAALDDAEVEEQAVDDGAPPADDEASAASPVDVSAEAFTAMSPDELLRATAKLKKRRQKVSEHEQQLLEMEEELLRRSEAMASEQSELADERHRLQVLKAQMDAEQRLLASAPPQSVEVPIRSGKRSGGGGAINRSSKNTEGTPLLPVVHSGDVDQFVYRVDHDFYDRHDFPQSLWAAAPVLCGLVKYTLHARPVLVGLCLAIIGAAAGGRFGAGDSLTSRQADQGVQLFVVLTATALVGLWQLRKRAAVLDLFNAVDQSMICSSGTTDGQPIAYPTPVLGHSMLVMALLGAVASFAMLFDVDLPVAARVGFAIALALTCWLCGAVLVEMALAAHVLWFRIASVVPRCPGALLSRISMRAALARYQHVKQLAQAGSKLFSSIALMMLVTVAVMTGAVYNIVLEDGCSFHTARCHLYPVLAFTAAAAILAGIVVLLSCWTDATSQIIANIGVQADRWVRGDYNAESDAKLEDYVAAQALLRHHLFSGEIAQWTVDVAPFLRHSESLVVPREFRNLTVAPWWRAVVGLLLIAGLVLIPISARGV